MRRPEPSTCRYQWVKTCLWILILTVLTSSKEQYAATPSVAIVQEIGARVPGVIACVSRKLLRRRNKLEAQMIRTMRRIVAVGLLRSGLARAQPNVLFVAIDDMNDCIGPLGGHPQAITPNLDRVAKMGGDLHQCPYGLSRLSFVAGGDDDGPTPVDHRNHGQRLSWRKREKIQTTSPVSWAGFGARLSCPFGGACRR